MLYEYVCTYVQFQMCYLYVVKYVHGYKHVYLRICNMAGNLIQRQVWIKWAENGTQSDTLSVKGIKK